jgi:primosomal protein N' (replication factor Y)
MVLLNRRGFSSFVACRSCGTRVECINCALTLTWHRRDRRLLVSLLRVCREGSDGLPEVPERAHSLHGRGIGARGGRTARRISGGEDCAAGSRHGHRASASSKTFCNNFRERNFDILVGTQMIAKGHDIPNVTLVGVVSADVGLGMPDFRAAERTFQLLTQVAGRAGRGHLPGVVYMQTINPDHYAIRLAASRITTRFSKKNCSFGVL